jgi:hypothetical protein
MILNFDRFLQRLWILQILNFTHHLPPKTEEGNKKATDSKPFREHRLEIITINIISSNSFNRIIFKRIYKYFFPIKMEKNQYLYIFYNNIHTAVHSNWCNLC